VWRVNAPLAAWLGVVSRVHLRSFAARSIWPTRNCSSAPGENAAVKRVGPAPGNAGPNDRRGASGAGGRNPVAHAAIDRKWQLNVLAASALRDFQIVN
jgi:hypothetical protein